MREKRVECPKCKKAMNVGFLLPYSKFDQSHPAQWVEGVPQKSVWTGTMVNRRAVIPVLTYRCQACGFLESYARS